MSVHYRIILINKRFNKKEGSMKVPHTVIYDVKNVEKRRLQGMALEKKITLMYWNIIKILVMENKM